LELEILVGGITKVITVFCSGDSIFAEQRPFMSDDIELEPGDPVIPRKPDEALELELQISLRLKLDESVELEATALRVKARHEPSSRELCDLARRIYDARRTRTKVLASRLFGEPAWDMLLALYCHPNRGLTMTAGGLSDAADVAQTTGLRWQKVLLDEGLIKRGPQEVDAGRQIVRLSHKGRMLMTTYLKRLFDCGVPVCPTTG
jgi:DNA-binding MarR family transcriptional regulator